MKVLDRNITGKVESVNVMRREAEWVCVSKLCRDDV